MYLSDALKETSVMDIIREAITIDYDRIADVVAAKMEPRISELEAQLREKDEEIATLQGRVAELERQADDQEQYSRRTSIRISGVPENQGEDIIAVTKDLLSKIECDPVINRVHRVGPVHESADSPRSILCQFLSYGAKAHVMKQRSLLKTKAQGVFINEDLTRKRSKLLYQCRKLVKDGKIDSAWSFDGRIAIKTKNDRVIVPIRKESDLTTYKSA